MASSSLSNLPSRGIFSGEAFSWNKRPVSAPVRAASDAAPDQVLTTDDSTEALVRILKRQQHATAATKGKATPATNTNKRPMDPPPTGPSGQKRPVNAFGLAAGTAATGTPRMGSGSMAPAAGGGGGGAGPSGTTPGAAAEEAAGPSVAAAAANRTASRTASYSQEELRGKSIKELQELLKARGLPVSGKKEALMQRVVDYQRRQKMAAMGVGTA